MRPEIGKYYKLNPTDHREIIGLCVSKSRVDENSYTFEYWVKLYGKWEYRRGSFVYYPNDNPYSSVKTVSDLEVQKYSLERELVGRLPKKLFKRLVSL